MISIDKISRNSHLCVPKGFEDNSWKNSSNDENVSSDANWSSLGEEGGRREEPGSRQRHGLANR